VVSSTPGDDDLYRIGTVASLTGISVERLRAWERRYQMSPAHKSGKTRYYSKPQLERLRLIKHLIDQGHPISSLAQLSYEQLAERIETEREQTKLPRLTITHTPRIGLVGPNLLLLEQQVTKNAGADSTSQVEVVSRWANMQAFETEQNDTDDPQVIVVQLPVLSIQPLDLIREFFPETKVIALYQFATSAIISETQRMQIPTLKWPVTWREIEHVCLNESGAESQSGSVLPRRFSDEELIAIAASSNDPTQCPEYLVEAINQLNAFAAYTLDCVPSGSRAEVYEQVHADATQARARLELALETLLESEVESVHAPKRTTH
jgi:DNA-binding transcriptional MerR regulator